MKLPNFIDDPQFNDLRFRMKAPLSKFDGIRVGLAFDPVELAKLGNEGVDVSFDEVKDERDGTLSYKGIRVIVYIRDINIMNNRQRGQIHLPRFHVAYCSTLEYMRHNKRWQRYVVATRADGSFQIRLIDGKIIKAQVVALPVCQNCLSLLQWEKFSYQAMSESIRLAIVRNFTIGKFFERYPRELLSVRPEHTADTAPINDYTTDFWSIAERLKREHENRCENCNRVIEPSWLHVHHKNGCRSDNQKHNLLVLCFGCHANQPMHNHMKNLPRYKEFVLKFGNLAT